jgi:hypothetical protein
VGVLDPPLVEVAGAVLVSEALGADEPVAVELMFCAGCGALVQPPSTANRAPQIASRRAARIS